MLAGGLIAFAGLLGLAVPSMRNAKFGWFQWSNGSLGGTGVNRGHISPPAA